MQIVFTHGAADEDFLGIAAAGSGVRIALRERQAIGPRRQATITLSREEVRDLTRNLVAFMAQGDRALGIAAAEAAP